MNKILLVFAVIAQALCIYFFFIGKYNVDNYLLYGSISILIATFLSITYAMLSSVNKLSDEETKKSSETVKKD